MKMDFPLAYSLQDETQVKVDLMEDGKTFTFYLDKPTGQTDSFTWAEDGAKPDVQTGSEDPQREEAIALFLSVKVEE